MPNAFAPKDIYALMSELVSQATGQKDIAVFDTDSFVSAGELALSTGTENVLNALSLIVGRTLIAVRPYNARLISLNNLGTGKFTHRLRKISYYSDKPLPSGYFNTDLYTNFAYGYDNGTNGATGSTPATNSTASMWEQHPPIPLEMNFYSSDTWQECITIYEDKLETAFRDERSFSEFVAGFMTQKANDIEMQKEAFNRMTLLSRMALSGAIGDASSYIKGAQTAIDLKAEYNAKYGLTGANAKTTAELLTTDLQSFLQFFVSYFKTLSDLMTYPSVKYFAAPLKSVGGASHYILRHTPKDRQRLIMYNPFWNDAKAMVYSEIFNEQYLQPAQFEAVDWWQSYTGGPAVNLKVTVPGWLESMITNGSTTADTSYTFDVPYVLGVLFDEDAVMVDYQLDKALTTPVEARKGYRSTWYTFQKGAIIDPTECFIVLYLSADETTENTSKGGDEVEAVEPETKATTKKK